MSTIFRKNINLKNLRNFKYLFRNINNECHISRPSTFLITSVSRHQCFATAALPKYNHNEKKEKIEAGNLNNVSLQDVDNMLLDMDYTVKRTGRCSKTKVENVLNMIEKLGSASDVHGLYLLRCSGLMLTEKSTERVKMAHLIWEKLQKLGVQFDVKHYNSLLKVFIDCDHQFSPSEFLASMENSEVEPNKATYLLLLQKYSNDGNLNGAGEILECLKEKGLPINESVFTILIKGHMRANDISGAKDILEVMRSANLSPTAESYAALACGYAEKGNIDGLNSILDEANNNNIAFSNKHYLNIMTSFSDAENAKINELLGKISDVFEWRQEIANAMIGLIFKGMDDIAFKLLLKIANPENNFVNIFLKVLLKCDCPKEKIVEYCEEISDRKLHDYIFMNATKAAIDFGKFELALTLFEALQKKGIPVRPNNLHLLLSSFKDKEEGIWLILRKMFELGVPADFFTYFEYVFPAVSISDPEAVISKIQETGHSCTAAVDPLFQFYCYRREFDKALYLIENYPVGIHPSFSLENYINACKDINTYSKASLKVLKYLLENIRVPGEDSEVTQGINFAALIQKDTSLFEALLRTPEEKIQLSRESYEVCASVLKRNNPILLRYLRRLGNFRNKSSDKRVSRSIAEEEKELKFLKERGLPTERYILECLSDHLKTMNITRINQLVEELEMQKKGAQYPPTTLALLLSVYCQNNDLEKAEKYFKVLKNDYPTFNLDSLKVIDYATLLVKYSKFDDAVNLIKEECQELHLFSYPEAAFRKCVRNFLNIAVETGNSDLVKTLQDSLSSHTEILQSNVLYEPLVKMYLYKNDIDSAINEFENCVKNQRIAPCLRLLMKKCIVTENSTKLDFVIRTASSLGKHLVLYELAMAFLETGRKSEAKKIMENVKDKSYYSGLEDTCSQLYNQNKVLDLLELVNILWAVDHIDREKIVHYLLKLSNERNDSKTAKELFNSVVKNFELSDEMKELFSKALSKNKKNVLSVTSKSDVAAFLRCLQEKDAHQALKNLQSMKKGVVRTLGFSDMTNFLDLLIKNKILNDLLQDANATSYMFENANEILKPLLEKYSSSGDIDSLIEILNVFPDFALKKSSYNIYLSKAYFLSERHEDLLLELEKRWDKENKLFSVFAFEELLKSPGLEKRVIKLAEKYLECNFNMPIAMVWAHYLIQGRYDEADTLYKSHSVSADKVDVLIMRTIRKQENVNLGKAYIAIINNTDASKRCKERIYGTVLDVLVLKEMYSDAATLVIEAQEKEIDLQTRYQSTLITLKNALERENKNVPFSIPSEGYIISE